MASAISGFFLSLTSKTVPTNTLSQNVSILKRNTIETDVAETIPAIPRSTEATISNDPIPPGSVLAIAIIIDSDIIPASNVSGSGSIPSARNKPSDLEPLP